MRPHGFGFDADSIKDLNNLKEPNLYPPTKPSGHQIADTYESTLLPVWTMSCNFIDIQASIRPMICRYFLLRSMLTSQSRDGRILIFEELVGLFKAFENQGTELAKLHNEVLRLTRTLAENVDMLLEDIAALREKDDEEYRRRGFCLHETIVELKRLETSIQDSFKTGGEIRDLALKCLRNMADELGTDVNEEAQDVPEAESSSSNPN